MWIVQVLQDYWYASPWPQEPVIVHVYVSSTSDDIPTYLHPLSATISCKCCCRSLLDLFVHLASFYDLANHTSIQLPAHAGVQARIAVSGRAPQMGSYHWYPDVGWDLEHTQHIERILTRESQEYSWCATQPCQSVDLICYGGQERTPIMGICTLVLITTMTYWSVELSSSNA
jgi:hypothetical protein